MNSQEAGIAYWHTHKEDTREKWENILHLYNHLLILACSPIASLNRTFALAKTHGKEEGIKEAKNSTWQVIIFSIPRWAAFIGILIRP
jgi:predicted RNA polymerase sigma factor